MSRIVKAINTEVIHRTAKRCRELGVVLPTFKQMRDPASIPDTI